MKISPFPTPIPYARQWIDDNDVKAVVDTLRSDFVAQGPKVEAFESALREFTGARYAVAVSSGTAALHLSCLGLGLGPGDLGVVPAMTFAATANCLRYVGAEVAFCDVDSRSGIASPEHFSATLARFSTARALLPVSYSGSVPDLPALAQRAERAGAFVIEDAAHSLGAVYAGDSRSGSCAHSDAAILSFHPVKHICAGEGGAILTNDPTLARRVRRLRSHGIEKRSAWLYDQGELGYHYRMTDLQAALGLSQLRRLPRFLDRRKELARIYQNAFVAEPFASRIRISNTDEGSSRHLFVVHFAGEGERRAAYDYFHAHNVRVQVHYLPVYRHSYYDDGSPRLSGTEAFYSGCLSLPLYPMLADEEQAYVIDCLRSFLQS